MKVTYDKQADAMYIYLKKINPKGVEQTISLNEDINVDYDKNKKIVGIEILSASKNLAKKQIKQVEKIVA